MAEPTTVVLRPLTGGMRTDKSSLETPVGSFRTLKGYDVRQRGPRRIDGKVPFLPNPVPFWFAGEQVTDLLYYWGTDDQQYNVAITNKCLYNIEFANTTSAYGTVWWQRDYQVSTYVGATKLLTFKTYNAATDGVRVGDSVVFSTIPDTAYAITNVAGTVVTLEVDPLVLHPGLVIADTPFNVIKVFQCDAPDYVDYTSFARSTEAWTIFVDGSPDGIYRYNGGYLQPFPLHFPGTPDTPSYNAAKTVMYYGGRLYFGNVLLTGATYRQRTVWTEVLDLQETPADAYQDMDETPGQILKLVGLGSLAFCYFNDAAYYGRQTNLAGLPYSFTRLDTGGVGLAGIRAASTFLDGQLFVSSDDIYYVTPSAGISPIGMPVLAGSVKRSYDAGTLDRTQVKVDVPRQRVLIGFCFGDNYFQEIYAFNYTTKAWSFWAQEHVTAFNTLSFADEIQYDDIDPADDYADYTDVPYSALGTAFADRMCTFVDPAGYLNVLEFCALADTLAGGSTVPVDCVIETGDMDFEMPDMTKTITELRVKVSNAENPRTQPISFVVTGSLDRGDSWKALGNLVIPSSKSEGSVGFRLTGSHVRFRLTSASVVEPYELTEMTLRVVLRDLEGNRGATSSDP